MFEGSSIMEKDDGESYQDEEEWEESNPDEAVGDPPEQKHEDNGDYDTNSQGNK